MSHRIRRFAAPLALTILAATQALTATAATIAFTPPQLPHLSVLCFTRVLFAPGTTGQTFSRRCDAGEKPGSVRTIYVG